MGDSLHDRRLRLKLIWLAIGLLYMGYVIYVTLAPRPPSIFTNFLYDKAYHFLGYLCLMGWFGLIFHSGRARIILAILFVLLGIALEFLQGMGGVRQFEVADMFANSLGVLAAWLLVLSPLRHGLDWFEKHVLRLP